MIAGRWMGLSLVLVAASAAALPAAPWSKGPKKPAAKTTGKPASKAEAKPDAKTAGGVYQLGENNGPWMIMAASFAGEGAEQQAEQLVQELRTKYKLPAYMYQKKFDFSKDVKGRGVDRYGGPQSMRYQRDEALTEIAVMVGDYPQVADPDAQKVLKKIKYLTPAALSSAETTTQTLASIKAIQRRLQPDGSEEKKKGPMGSAFVTTNPLLPKDYFVPQGLDKLVYDMNKGVKHSLLTCPGRYSVKVATFNGQVVLSQKVIEKLENGSAMKSRLAEAAEKAHRLVDTLRSKGVEAYEFHDRYSSIVTVGSFASVGSRRADGKIEIDPAVHAVIQKYGAETKVTPGQAAPQLGKPKTEGSIPFDLSPVPVEVPRRSIAADYGRTADNR